MDKDILTVEDMDDLVDACTETFKDNLKQSLFGVMEAYIEGEYMVIEDRQKLVQTVEFMLEFEDEDKPVVDVNVMFDVELYLD